MATSAFDEDSTMEVVMKNIYTSCDPENTNFVPVSKLIDFITPYMLEDLSALKSLKDDLDPQNTNVCVSSEKFYEVMNEWTKKIVNISDENSDFNRTPSQLDMIDDNQLPYTQSTPRASFGQKLLSCEGLLNLSNVSSYSLSTTVPPKDSTVGAENTILEEEVKRLEHHLNRMSNEMVMVKLHLTATEEHNEVLQADLDRCKTRLHSEQQIIEHLQNDKRYNDELREELNSSRKQIEELNKKVVQYEKDNVFFQSVIEKTDKENLELEQRCCELSKREQEAKKQIIDIKTDLDLKDQEISTILKVNEELKVKLNKQRDIIDQLRNENELLDHKKNSLETALKENISARRDSLVSQYKTCLADSSSFPSLGTIPIYSSPIKHSDSLYNNSEFLERVLSPVSPTFNTAKITAVKAENLLQKVLRSSTPKSAERPLSNSNVSKEFQDNCVLNSMHSDIISLNSHIPTRFLPTTHNFERSNVVKDQNSEEEYYVKIQETDFKSFPHESLQTEISQVSFDTNKVSCSLLSFEKNEKLIDFEEQNKHFNTVEKYLAEIGQLRLKNDDIQSKLDQVNKNNETLSLEVRTMMDKINVLEQDISNISREKEMSEKHLQNIQIEKNKLENELEDLRTKNSQLIDENNNLLESNTSISSTLKLKSKIMTELEEKLLELKQEYCKLQDSYVSKDKELCDYKHKFDFEIAYKNIQIELNEKNKEISEISKSKEDLQESLVKLTDTNQELQKSLAQAITNLKQNEDKSKQMMTINENIEQTASQVQVHITRKNAMINELVELNKKFEQNISNLQEDLQDKFKEITELKETVKSDMEIKNRMWQDNKELQLELDTECKKNEKLLNELLEIQNNIKKEKEEYNTLLAKYNHEIEKNCELCAEIAHLKKELSSTIDKYNQELNNNQIIYEKMSAFKTEIEVIKESQTDCKTKVDNKLNSYEDIIKKLEVKLEGLKMQNNILQAELECEKKKPKKERFFDVDVSSSESFKNRSFDKQQMQIDRLKEKLETTEAQLSNEKIKNSELRNMIIEKTEEEEEYAKRQLEYERAERQGELEKHKLQCEIEKLLEKLKRQVEKYKKLENVMNEKETVLLSQLSQVEENNQHLCAEITNKDCIINNIYVEMERLKNADKRAQELSTSMSAKLFELNEKEKEIQYLNATVIEKNNSILSLSSKIEEQEVQLSQSLRELIETRNINTKLEEECKSLQERLEKNNLNEKELTEAEQKLKNATRLLQCNEMELSLIEKKLANTKMEFDCISNEMSEQRDMISYGNSELSRVFSLILSKWEGELDLEDIRKELLILKECEKEDNLSELNKKIKLAVSLLKIWVSKVPTFMEDSEFNLNGMTNVDNITDQCSLSDGKIIKKFTLRPPRFTISRPASPDSPSLDVDFKDIVNLNEKHIEQSPDKGICHDFFLNEDSYASAYDELSFSQFPDLLELTPFQDSFLNVSDIFLEKEGLHEHSPKKNLTEKETEELFTTFAIQIVLDSKDIKERLEKQKDRCSEQQIKFVSLIKDISNRLRDHKCIGAVDPINPVFILLEDMKYLLKDLSQSTIQFGILSCESRMMKCWNLVTNYMALLKQKSTNLELSPVSRNQNESEVIRTLKSTGDNIRKRQKNQKKKDGKHPKSPVLLDSTEVNLRRCNYFPTGRFIITLAISLVVFILILSIVTHWQCRMNAPESQACILDDFIKKIQVGDPPY